MKRNMGMIDRVIRMAFAVLVILLYYSGYISGTVAIILGAVALVFIITSAIGFCPLYLPFKISTMKKNKS